MFLRRWRWHAALATTLIGVASTAVFAQTPGPGGGPASTPASPPGEDRRGRQIVPFLERSYLFWSNRPRDLLFEAAVFPHLVLWQNFDDLVDARVRRQPGDGHGYWAFSITPGVHLRMFQGFSDPVRTPSYMPRADVQRLWSTNYREAITALNRRARASVDLWEWHVAVRHHSNGQDGCLFAAQAFDGTTCTPASPPAVAPGPLNLRDGSFSTNDVRGGVHFRRTRLEGTGEGRSDVSLGLEYQRQFWTEPDQKPFYSQNRVNLLVVAARAGVRGCASRLEIALTETIAVDRPVATVARFGHSAQASCFPSNKGGFGVFVKWARGQDSYNLGFLSNLSRVQFGIAFNQDGFFRFRAPR